MRWICISAFVMALISAAEVFFGQGKDRLSLLGDVVFLLSIATFLTALVVMLARRIYATTLRPSSDTSSGL